MDGVGWLTGLRVTAYLVLGVYMDFWSSHYSFSKVARELGTTRQNVYQRCLRKSIPCDRDPDGKPGVPIEWVEKTLALRKRDSHD